MKILCLKHVPFEGPDLVKEWASGYGHSISIHLVYEGGELPEMESFDLLLVMGGPMSVHDESEHPWLVQEKVFIREALDAGKKLVGICLGAQLLALVLGASVGRNVHNEVGWFPVKNLGHPVANGLPSWFQALHWHGDTFSLPEGAQPLFESVACKNQGFLYNGQALALQFHLELSAGRASMLADESPEDFVGKQPWVQSPEVITSQYCRFACAKDYLDTILKNFLNIS